MPSVEIKNPTVNVVVSLDSELMRDFLETGSLKEFKKKAVIAAKRDPRNATALFDNTINSNFISLNHKYNTDENGAELTLEFIDPQYAFEENTIFEFDINALNALPKDPLTAEWKRKRDQLAETKRQLLSTNPATPYSMAVKGAREGRLAVNNEFNQLMIDSGHGIPLDPNNQAPGVLRNITRPGLGFKGLGSVFAATTDDDLVEQLREGVTQNKYGNLITKERIDAYLKETQIVTNLELQRDNLLDQRFALIKELKVLENEQQRHGAQIRILKLLAAGKYQTSLFQDPVYIAYGVGDDIKRDWCTPQCFGKVYKAEYAYSGDGARILKLTFGGLGGIGGVLGTAGLTPLGKAGDKIVTVGESNRLFNEAASAERLDALRIAIEKDPRKSAFRSVTNGDSVWYQAVFPKIPGCSQQNRSWTPSLHLAFKECMTRYLEAALPDMYAGNVAVFFPNLDKYLVTSWTDAFAGAGGPGNQLMPWSTRPYGGDDQSATGTPLRLQHERRSGATMPLDRVYHNMGANPFGSDVSGMAWFGAYASLAESLGLFLMNAPPYSKVGKWDESITPEVDLGFHEYRTSRDTVTENPGYKLSKLQLKRIAGQVNSTNVTAWWENKDISLTCKNNFYTPFTDKLKGVGRALADAFDNSKVKDTPAIHPQIYIETDQVVLTAMKESGFIKRSDIPAIIWADSYSKMKYLDARILEQELDTRKDLDELLNEVVADQEDLHLVDKLYINKEYLKDVFNHLQPLPHIGPFGHVGKSSRSISDDLDRDSNVRKTFNNYSDDNYIMADRLPVFAFGVKGSNILKVKMDLNNAYTSLLHMGQGKELANQIVVSNFILQDKGGQGVPDLGLDANDFATFFVKFEELQQERKEAEGRGKEGADAIPLKFKELVERYWLQSNGAVRLDRSFATGVWAGPVARAGISGDNWTGLTNKVAAGNSRKNSYFKK